MVEIDDQDFGLQRVDDCVGTLEGERFEDLFIHWKKNPCLDTEHG